MAPSLFQMAANRANSQLSTGPRTPEGKERSRQNSYKHGFKALLIPCIEDSAAVEASRDRWLDCFPGDDEVTRTLADMAFRCKRRLESVADSDDAAVALRVEKAAEAYYVDLRAGIDDAWEAFRQDPSVGVEPMKQSESGLLRLFNHLDDLLKHAGDVYWSEADGRRLLGLERLDGVEDLDRMEDIVGMFMMASGCEMLSAETEEASAEHMEMRRQAIGSLDSVRERRAAAQNELKGRITALMMAVQRKMRVIEGSDQRTLQYRLNEAKFDPSDEARLRRRYLAEAQRDFLKVLGDARKASGAVPAKVVAQKVETPEPEPETEESGSSEVEGEASPNEAKSGCVEDAGIAGAVVSEVVKSGSRKGKRKAS